MGQRDGHQADTKKLVIEHRDGFLAEGNKEIQ